MSNKSFKAGMIAGAKPLEEKFQKQASAFDRVGDRLDGHLDVIEDKVDIVIDDSLARERKEIFGLNTLFDINSMDDTEKILVVSLLYTLAQRFESNDYQKNYIRSVQKYLGLKNVQPADTLTGVEGVKNFDDQKAILQVVMEYLFLECFSFDFLDEDDYEELFDSFNINRKGFRDVEAAIENIYQAVGAEGLAEKYGVIEEDDEDDAPQDESALPVEELDRLEQEAEKLFLDFKITEALEIFEKLVDYNYARAMYFVSEIYEQGFGVIKVNAEKAALLRKAGYEQGDSLCTLNYALMLTNKEEQKTVGKVLPVVSAIAQGEDVFAQHELARIYHQGLIVEKDTDTSLMLLNKSSVYWRSKFAIAYYNFNGISVKKNLTKAAELWEEVAELGYLEAAHNVYVCNKMSKLSPSQDEQMHWFELLSMAAEAKLRLSMYLLAEIYYEGNSSLSINRDRDKAKELLQASAEMGYKDAIKKLNQVESGKKISFLSWTNPYFSW